jgi:chromosome segregation ATPase
MKPLNNKERKKAFYKVVGLFLISFIIALILGFTTMNVGKLSEQNVNAELKKLKSHLKFQEEVFAPNVGKSTDLLSKIPSHRETGENLEVLNQDIGALLSQTKNQVEEDESWESTMYKNVIQALSDLQIAYNEQLKLKEQMGSSEDAESRLQACITERDRLQNQLNQMQAGGGGGGGADCAQIEKELKKVRQDLNTCNLENKALRQEIERIRNR